MSRTDVNHQKSRLGYLWLCAGLLAVFCMGGVLAYYLFVPPGLPALPDVDLSAADPDIADSIQTAEAAVRKRPNEQRAWGNLAMVFHAHSYFPEAHRCYSEARRLAPNKSRWAYLQAKCAHTLGTEEEIECLLAAVRSEKQYAPLSQIALGDALLQRGEIDEAEAAYRSALETKIQEARVYMGLARAAMARGNAKECVELLNQSLLRETRVHEPYELLVTAYHMLGDAERSAGIQKRLASMPKTRMAWSDPYIEEVEGLETGTAAIGRRANALYADGKHDAAIEILDKLVKRRPTSAPAWSGLGRMLVLCKRPSTAIPALEEAIRLAPDKSIPFLYLGAAYFDEGKVTESLSAYRKAIELQPNFADAHYELARVLFLSKEYEAAERQLKEVLRYDPNHSLTAQLLGHILSVQGNSKEAIAYLQQAVTLDPENKVMQRLLEENKAKLKSN